jgi:hypothetical protein
MNPFKTALANRTDALPGSGVRGWPCARHRSDVRHHPERHTVRSAFPLHWPQSSRPAVQEDGGKGHTAYASGDGAAGDVLFQENEIRRKLLGRPLYVRQRPPRPGKLIA